MGTGQTVSVSLGLNYPYNHYGSSKHIDIIFLTVGIYDGALLPTACKLAKLNEVVHKIYYTSCTVTNFTIVHNGLRYLQWCELFIQIKLAHHTDVYVIVIPWARVVCLIYTPEARGPQARGLRVYISVASVSI